jgi:hypothetical protein
LFNDCAAQGFDALALQDGGVSALASRAQLIRALARVLWDEIVNEPANGY